MPKNEKYVKEGDKEQLYINEGIDFQGKRIPDKEDKWIKFEESSIYDPGYKKKHAGDPSAVNYKDTLQSEIDYSFKKDFPDED